MIKEIFHGSKDIIEKPIFGYGKKTKDYGLGFYCAEQIDLAFEWAVDIDRDGFVNVYKIDTNDLKILYLDEYSVLHWLAILLENRTFTITSPLAIEAKEYLLKHFSINYRDYDIIVGYRADDSYFAFAQDFISGAISYQQLARAMKLGNLGKQMVLISEKAFSKISFERCEVAKSAIFYSKKKNRDNNARQDYFDTRKNKRNKDDLYINQIIDGEIKPNDPRL